jgi:hypothetical protein
LLLFHHGDRILDINNLREKGFILNHSFRGVSPSWWGRHGRAEQLTSWQPGSRENGYKKWPGQDIPQGHALSDLLPPKFLPPTIHHLSVMPSYYESIMG